MRALDRYRAEFPHGSLAAEEAVLRVRALMLVGDVGRATSLAERFSERYPESPYAKRMHDLVRGAP